MLAKPTQVSKKLAPKRKAPRTPVEDVFQALILREVLLTDGLKADLQVARVAAWLGHLLATPASTAIESFVKGLSGSVTALMARKATKAAVVEMFSGDAGLLIVRSARRLCQQVLRDRESSAHACCRTALCYAVAGEYAQAEPWLVDAEEDVGDLARPDFIRGLMLGAQGDARSAARALKKALEGRARDAMAIRIREALARAQAYSARA